jgi:hypothetical protein
MCPFPIPLSSETEVNINLMLPIGVLFMYLPGLELNLGKRCVSYLMGDTWSGVTSLWNDPPFRFICNLIYLIDS